MKIKVDKDNDALYLRLDESPIIESEEVYPGIILDSDKEDRIVGIEILSTRISQDQLKILQYEIT